MKTKRATVTCLHQAPLGLGRFTCALNLYGGKPYLGNCIACVTAGDNTAEGAARIIGGADLSHPPDKPAVSGCCDSAEP